MLRSLLIYSLLLLSFTTLSQRRVTTPPPKLACGTRSPTLSEKAMLERRMQAILKLKRQLRQASGPTYVPIRINVVRRSDGSGMEQYTPALLSMWLGMANEQHRDAGTGLQFYYVGNGPNYIDSDERYARAMEATPEDEEFVTNGHVVNNALNLYIVLCNGFGGFANFPTHDDVTTTRLYLSRVDNATSATSQRFMGYTLAHELGHTFGLYHTFQDINSPDVTQRELVTRTAQPGKLPHNCTDTGDLLCDTPADPYQLPNGSTGSESCGTPYAGTAVDANGDPYTPLLDNVMSYYNLYLCGLGKFTNGQLGRMQTGLGIRQGHASYTMNAPATAQTAPQLLSAVALGTRVALTWQAGSGPPFGYIIERSNSAAGPFITAGGANAHSTTYNDFTYDTTQPQFYRLRSANNLAIVSNVIGISDGCNGAPNTPVANMSVTDVTSTAATLRWTATPNTGYVVRWNALGDTPRETFVVGSNLPLSDLTPGTIYDWSVQADCGQSTPGTSFTTVCPAPVDLQATLVANSSQPVAFSFDWSNFSFVSEVRLLNQSTNVSTVYPISAFNRTVSGLTSGVFYTWAGRNVCDVTDNIVSEWVTAPQPISDLQPAPADPTNLMATVQGATVVHLAFTNNAADATGFSLERSVNNGSFTGLTTLPGNTTPGAVITYQDNTAQPSTQYQYRVQALKTNALASGFATSGLVATPPLPPTGSSSLLAAATSTTVIFLQWTLPGGSFTSQTLQFFTDNSTWQDLGVGAGTTSFNHSALTPGLVYYYRLRANGPGGSSNFVLAQAATLPAIPGSPTNLRLTVASARRFVLSFDDGSLDESSFSIERASGSGDFVPIASLPELPGVGGTASLTDTALAVGTAYRYRVRAVRMQNGLSNFSAYTNVVSATALPPIPGSPSSLMASVRSATQVALQFINGAYDATGFVVQRASGPGDFTQIATLPPVSGLVAVTYTDNNVTPGATYRYRVQAVRSENGASSFSGYSNEVSLSTQPPIPGSPTELVAGATSPTSVTLSFTDGSADETSFVLDRATGGQDFSQVAVLPAVARFGSPVAFTDTSVAPATTYRYRVRSVRTEYGLSSFSGFSNEASATTLQPTPAPPSSLTATPSSATAVTITWVDNATNETGFELEQSAGFAQFVKVADVAANQTQFALTGLRPNTIYLYRIRAVGSAGVSAYSPIAVAFTPNAAPAAPTNLVAETPSARRIVLRWQNNAANANSLVLERSTDNRLFAAIAFVAPNVATFADTLVQARTTYSYRLRAVNLVGASDYSNVASATPAATLNLLTQSTDEARPIWSANRRLYIRLASAAPATAEVRLLNASGQTARLFTTSVGSAEATEHDLNDMVSGIYVVVVQTGNRYVTERILVQ